MTWQPPGPVSAAFFENLEPISVLMGPVAGGKTVTGLQRGVGLSYLWPLNPKKPGVRSVRYTITRRLWKDLERTTMASWFQWYPRTMGQWLGDPPTHQLRFPHPDGSTIELEVKFVAFGDLRIEEALRGLETSYSYIDEVDLSPENALSFLRSRGNRYPQIFPGWHQLAWGTCNAPEEDNWVVTDFIDEPKPGHALYRQPSGLTAEAELVPGMSRETYERMAETMPRFERRRFIENIPGLSRAGDVVYEEFNPDLHVAAAELKVLDRPVIVGMDAGGTPAAGLWQRAPNGQWRKFAELSTWAKDAGSITGPNRFGEALRDLLAERCRGLPVHGLADPSAAYGADTANGEASWIDTVARVAAIRVREAPGNNDPSVRQEALRLPMSRMIDGRVPGLIICPLHCKLTARAYGRDYRFQMTAGRKTGIVKNWASHLTEADQYALLDGTAYHEVKAREAAWRASRRPVIAATDFNPLQEQTWQSLAR